MILMYENNIFMNRREINYQKENRFDEFPSIENIVEIKTK